MHKRAVLGAIENILTADSKKLKERSIEQKKEILEECDSLLNAVGDLVDIQDVEESSETIGAYFEGKMLQITKNNIQTEDSKSDGLNYHIVYDNWPNDDTDYRISNNLLRLCRGG